MSSGWLDTNVGIEKKTEIKPPMQSIYTLLRGPNSLFKGSTPTSPFSRKICEFLYSNFCGPSLIKFRTLDLLLHVYTTMYLLAVEISPVYYVRTSIYL